MQSLSYLRGDSLPPIYEDKSIHQLLDRLLHEDAQFGKQVALMQVDGNQITFNELNKRANQFAGQLAKIVVQSPKDSDRIVAVCLPRNIDLIIAILAIFKSGSPYLPLDTNFPPDRVAHILQDSKPILLLTSGTILSSSFTSVIQDYNVPIFDVDSVQQLDENSSAQFLEIHEDEDRTLAAVLYTSGSTGIPKGVQLEHKTIFHRLKWQWHNFPPLEDEIGCCKTALTFIDSVAEIWGPLLAGKPLLLLPKNFTEDTERFIELLDQYKVTRLFVVPSLLRAILSILKGRPTNSPPLLEKLKMWICAGEVLTSKLLFEFYDIFPAGTVMGNFYGSTEVGDVTIAAFHSKNQVKDALVDNRVPIG